MTADVDTAGTAASPVSSRRTAAGQNGAVPVDLHELQQALEAVRAGDFSVRLPTGRAGAMGRISVLFNEIVGANQIMAQQLERIGKSVGEQGRTRQRVKFALSTASWGEAGFPAVTGPSGSSTPSQRSVPSFRSFSRMDFASARSPTAVVATSAASRSRSRSPEVAFESLSKLSTKGRPFERR